MQEEIYINLQKKKKKNMGIIVDIYLNSDDAIHVFL